MNLRPPYSDNIFEITVNFFIFSLSNFYGLIIGGFSAFIMFYYIDINFKKGENTKKTIKKIK